MKFEFEIVCPYCKKIYASYEVECPNCEAPFEKASRRGGQNDTGNTQGGKYPWAMLIIAVVLFGIVFEAVRFGRGLGGDVKKIELDQSPASPSSNTTTKKTKAEGSIPQSESDEISGTVQNRRHISLLYQGRKCVLDKLTVRAEGTLDKVEWSGNPAREKENLSDILSPDQSNRARLIAHQDTSSGPVHVVVWTKLSSTGLRLDLSNWEGWLSHTQFNWLGDEEELKGIRNPVATFYFPEGDELEVPLKPGLLFITNRRFIEMSYAYYTSAGEWLEFNRRSHVLSSKHTITWGGSLSAGAYAMVTMKWASPGRSLLWGAYLHNNVGDVVSLNEFPSEKRHNLAATGHPTYLSFRQRFSDIRWNQTLQSTYGGYVPKDPENLTSRDLEKIGNVNRLNENYQVAISYMLDGKKVERNVPLSSFVTLKSKHASLQAPIHWGGRPAAYLDKLERIYTICRLMGKYSPEFIQMFWTNNYGSGYAVGPRSNKRIQMGFFDMRDRKGLYSLPDILVHEVLHTFGYKHGSEHNKVITAARRVFLQHRILLADHPNYIPKPITQDYSIEDARNFGAENHRKYPRIDVPRERQSRKKILVPSEGPRPTSRVDP